MRLFAQPMVAIVFGAFILCAETCLHVESILHPSTWIDLPIHDWVAGGFLVWSGVISRRDRVNGRPYQAAAWGFMLSLLLGAFLAHWEEWSLPQQTDEWISEGAFVGILGGLLVLAGCGLVSTLARR
ncbi:MAG TPA: hypothetical protein VES67_16760 [Vicinamibacterales bacterium]|nr:hypothetical protein [Vicinamibacterales bacterium]